MQLLSANTQTIEKYFLVAEEKKLGASCFMQIGPAELNLTLGGGGSGSEQSGFSVTGLMGHLPLHIITTS